MDSNSVKVVVAAPDGGLTEADSAKIMEIVKQETSLNATQIKIIQATS
jgi:tellurite resistance protein